jgi:phage terminase large subunit
MLDSSFSKGYTTASLQGSSRSSKTYSIVQWLIRRCYDEPGMEVSIVRKTMPALKRSVYRDFKDIMIEWGLWNDRAMNKSEFVYTFGNGSWVEFFSCEDEQKLRGSKRKILFVNEANEISFIEWQQLQMRTTEFSIIDYNPSFSEEHWINQVNSERKTCFWISTYKDNLFLEQKVIDEIESLQWKNKSLWQVYGLGQRAIVDGLIFPNVEIVDNIPRQAERRRFAGIDFGYASDPTAIIEVAFYRGTIYLNELCYQTHMLTSDIIRELKSIEWQPEIISESADPRMVDEIYNAGIDIKAVHKYQGSINAGLMKMKEYRICITRHSSNLIKEFHNYTYRQDKEGKWLNEPIDAFNHGIDAVRYVVLEKILGGYGSGMSASEILGIVG